MVTHDTHISHIHAYIRTYLLTYMLPYIHTYVHTNRQTDRQTDPMHRLASRGRLDQLLSLAALNTRTVA